MSLLLLLLMSVVVAVVSIFIDRRFFRGADTVSTPIDTSESTPPEAAAPQRAEK